MTNQASDNWTLLGGDAVMQPLITAFYQRVATSTIRHLFPPDFKETAEKQFAFQSEFWGGPQRYTPWRGFPRMRARHLPFAIYPEDAEVWMACMRASVEESAMPEAVRQPFLQKLQQVAQAMVNKQGQRPDPHPTDKPHASD